MDDFGTFFTLYGIMSRVTGEILGILPFEDIVSEMEGEHDEERDET